MNKYLQATLATVGSLLILASAWLCRSLPLRPEDASAAFERLAGIPVSQLETERSVDLTVVVPNSPAWRRIRKSWGDPGYIISAVSPGLRRDMYCLDRFHLSVQAMLGTQRVNLETAEHPPYGYSTNCSPAGLQFQAPPGATVSVHIATELNGFNTTAELIVEPYWAPGTKDHLVGIGIAQDFHLRTVANVLAIVGAATFLFAAFHFALRATRPTSST